MDITIINLQSAVAVPSAKIKTAVVSAVATLRLKFPEISIVCVGTTRMRAMNKKFLRHDDVTDVITFNHGEIVICPDVARRNAKHFKCSVADEIVLYVIHGLLHLAGYDDHTAHAIKKMRAMEQRLLAAL